LLALWAFGGLRTEAGEPDQLDRGLIDHRDDSGEPRTGPLRLMAVSPTDGALQELRLRLDDSQQVAESPFAGSDVGGRIRFRGRVKTSPAQPTRRRRKNIMSKVAAVKGRQFLMRGR
jgi:hypothetical protein